jgi:hypothetical protein
MNCYNHGNICAQKWPWLAFLEFNPLNLGHLGQIAKAWPQLSANVGLASQSLWVCPGALFAAFLIQVKQKSFNWYIF